MQVDMKSTSSLEELLKQIITDGLLITFIFIIFWS